MTLDTTQDGAPAPMLQDIRDWPLFREACELYSVIRRPGSAQIADATEIVAAQDGRTAIFVGSITEALEGLPLSRICSIDLASGQTQVLSLGPGTDRAPRVSPDGLQIAFLSDRERTGTFLPYVMDLGTRAVTRLPDIDGWVEYLHWSPDGRRLLLGVAGHGADVAGGQGAVASKVAVVAAAEWLPLVETGDEAFRWRSVWIWPVGEDACQRLSSVGTNVWDASWSGNASIAAVCSEDPGEGYWYSAHLRLFDLTGESRHLHSPRDQIGWIGGSPDGAQVAIVDALCSDRGVAAGAVTLIHTTSGEVLPVDTGGVDVSYGEWRSSRRLLLSGHRGFETVVGIYDLDTSAFTETFASEDVTSGGFYVSVAGLGDAGDCLLGGRGFARAPEVGHIRDGHYRTIASFDLGYNEVLRCLRAVEKVIWTAPDGLQLHGWLLLPHGDGPYPLVMHAHGGPVWQFRPAWLSLANVMLLQRGYALFFPNPRGSSGRGRVFVRHVVGDMGGKDTFDFLSGLDHLVERGIADRKRLGVTGGSYGGFISSWLITQDDRFAAAVPQSPVTNHVTEHLIGNIPHFVKMFLADDMTNSAGRYFERSPVMHAHKVRTPTLNIAGAADRCTPPEEAVQFHRALLEHGVESVLVVYPGEGHGVRKLPASIDLAARIVWWFERHMPSGGQAS